MSSIGYQTTSKLAMSSTRQSLHARTSGGGVSLVYASQRAFASSKGISLPAASRRAAALWRRRRHSSSSMRTCTLAKLFCIGSKRRSIRASRSSTVAGSSTYTRSSPARQTAAASRHVFVGMIARVHASSKNDMHTIDLQLSTACT